MEARPCTPDRTSDAAIPARSPSQTDPVIAAIAAEKKAAEELAAAELAEITDYKIRNYPDYKVELEDRFSGFPFMKTKEKLFIEEFGEENYKIYKTLKSISNLKGIQARMPYIIEFH